MNSKYLLIGIFSMGIIFQSQAQFLKKLKEKVEEAAEKAVLNKTGEMVTQKSEQALDSLIQAFFTMDFTSPEYRKRMEEARQSGAPMAEPENVDLPDNNIVMPDAYSFSYQAVMKLTNGTSTKTVTYLLEPDVPYYAVVDPHENFTQYEVRDNERNVKVFFGELDGEKRRAQSKMDIFTILGEHGAKTDSEDLKTEPIGSKKILGYSCQGFRMSSSEGVTELWITNEAPATAYRAMFASREGQEGSPFTAKTMILAMTFTAAANPAESYSMECTAYGPASMHFVLSEYTY